MAGLSFPRDEGVHPDARNEWWYFNSRLSSSDGRDFGLHFNFVRDRLVVMLADNVKREMVCREVLTGARFRGSTSRLDLSFGSSWWRQSEGDPSAYDAHVECGDLAVTLAARSLKRPLLVNGEGRIREGLLGESYYYAQTRLDVSGSIRLGGREVRVSGLGWVDRQWGDWEWTGLGAWSWFSLQLRGGDDLIGFVIRHPLSGGVVGRALNASASDGSVRLLERFSLHELAGWTSPRSGVRYGSSWLVESPGALALRINARFPDQELLPGFWEGTCSVEGSFGGGRVEGDGYFEQADPVVRVGKRAWMLYMPIGVVNHMVHRAFHGAGPDVWKHLAIQRVQR